jgi:hypothetical protein
MLAAAYTNAYLPRMDQAPAPAPLPEGWAESLARGEADLAAGLVHTIDTDALCREIEAEADALERQIAVRHASPA